MSDFLAGIVLRDLAAVRRELEAYPTEADIWKQTPAIPNSAGTLALHLTGNLRYYVGAVLGGTDYVRDRDAEFWERGVPREEVLRRLNAAAADVEAVIPRLSDGQLASTFPVPVAGKSVVTLEWLTHLAVHLAYHLGQIDYHRRLLGGSPKAIGAVAAAELRSLRPAP